MPLTNAPPSLNERAYPRVSWAFCRYPGCGRGSASSAGLDSVSDGYGVGALRDDLARFTFLLGETGGEGLFSPRRAAPS
jgi:hypothetical protein